MSDVWEDCKMVYGNGNHWFKKPYHVDHHTNWIHRWYCLHRNRPYIITRNVMPLLNYAVGVQLVFMEKNYASYTFLNSYLNWYQDWFCDITFCIVVIVSWLVDNVTHYSMKGMNRDISICSMWKFMPDLLLRQAPGNLFPLWTSSKSKSQTGVQIPLVSHHYCRLLSGRCVLYTVLVGFHMYCRRREAVSVILY